MSQEEQPENMPSRKAVYQTDRAGFLVGITDADESPLEPGVFHIPGGAVELAPPETWGSDQWPRWDGRVWKLVRKPTASNAAARLVAFLAANPDVAALLEQKDL